MACNLASGESTIPCFWASCLRNLGGGTKVFGFDVPVLDGGHIGLIPGILVDVVGNPAGDLVAYLDRQFFSFAKGWLDIHDYQGLGRGDRFLCWSRRYESRMSNFTLLVIPLLWQSNAMLRPVVSAYKHMKECRECSWRTRWRSGH